MFRWNYVYVCLPLQMAQLSNLYLQDNLMMKIPFASFSHVSQLKTLDVSRNRIENLLDSHYASGAVKVIIRSFQWQFPCLSIEMRNAQLGCNDKWRTILLTQKSYFWNRLTTFTCATTCSGNWTKMPSTTSTWSTTPAWGATPSGTSRQTHSRTQRSNGLTWATAW